MSLDTENSELTLSQKKHKVYSAIWNDKSVMSAGLEQNLKKKKKSANERGKRIQVSSVFKVNTH